MNYDSDEDRYDSSVYSDDESILNQKDDDSYMDEEEMPEEFLPMMKPDSKPEEIRPHIDTKIPDINPWTKKPNQVQYLQQEKPVMSMMDIIKQQEVEKQVELEKKKKEDSKKTKSILLNRKSNNQNNKITGFRKRTFQYKASS